MEGKNSCRKRGQNFSATEVSVILEMCRDNSELLRSTLNNEVTIKKKNHVWKEITEKVNSCGVTKREVGDVKIKWKAMQASAKKKMVEKKKDINKTGGGPASSSFNESDSQIITLFSENPSWSGISGGIEAEINPASTAIDIDSILYCNVEDVEIKIDDVPASPLPTLPLPALPQPADDQTKSLDCKYSIKERMNTARKALGTRKKKAYSQQDVYQKQCECLDKKMQKLEAELLKIKEETEYYRKKKLLLECKLNEE